MDKIWDITTEFLAKINVWIPLVTILWAGIGLVGIVLILAVTGCFLRKRLVPQWLIWTYFTFSAIIIFAQANNDIFTVVANLEIPCLVVLLCYLLRLLFYRRPRYTYLEQTVYARKIVKGKLEKPEEVVTESVEEENQDGQEKDQHFEEELAISRKEQRKAEKAAREYEKAAREAEKAAQEAEAREKAATEKANREIAAAEEAARQAAAEKLAAEKAAVAEKVSTEKNTASTIDLPVVEPIPDKTYEATREPTIVATPVSETMPELKMPNTNIQLRYNNTSSTMRSNVRPNTTTTATTVTRPTTMSTTSNLTTRPSTTTTTTVTPNRTVTTETTTTPLNAYTAMYNPRVVKTTTTTTTTTTNTNSNTLNAINASRTVNGKTTGASAVKVTSNNSNTSNPRSTEDIMAAIERLRASMKK